VITSDTLTATGKDLTSVTAALDDVAIAARHVLDLGGRPSHEIAMGDLANLRTALGDYTHPFDLDELWPVFIFAKRLAAPNEFPGLGGGPDRVTPAGQRRRWWHRFRSHSDADQYDALRDLRRAVNIAVDEIDEIQPS
jgi:hypothetical protein